MIGTDQLPDYYAELDVSAVASHETIRAAYVALAKRFHPDLNPQRSAAERMQRVNEAYAVVGDDRRRRVYDLQRQRGAASVPAAEPVRPDRRTGPFSNAGAAYVRPESAEAGPAAEAPVSEAPAAEPSRRRPWRRAGYLALGLLVLGGVVVSLLILGVRLPHSGSRTSPPAPVHPSATHLAPTATLSPTSAGANYDVDDFVMHALRLFHEASSVVDVSGLETAADRAWTLQAGNCLIFAGEYDTPVGWDAARSHWLQLHVGFEAMGNLVIAVKDCNGADQAGGLERVRTALASIR